jgi:hypothetical protein
VYIEPKLLNHGGKRDDQGSNNNLGRGKDYTIARLQRDGQHELADQVKAGTKSARQAAIEAGFKVPESQLTILNGFIPFFIFSGTGELSIKNRTDLNNPH